jgi:hypothetical protein
MEATCTSKISLGNVIARFQASHLKSNERQVLATRVRMARWIVSCPACNAEFTHTEINGGGARAFLSARKPNLDGGSVKECPHCHAATVFRPAQLIYRKA